MSLPLCDVLLSSERKEIEMLEIRTINPATEKVLNNYTLMSKDEVSLIMISPRFCRHTYATFLH